MLTYHTDRANECVATVIFFCARSVIDSPAFTTFDNFTSLVTVKTVPVVCATVLQKQNRTLDTVMNLKKEIAK